jgi:hypothetical protein
MRGDELPGISIALFMGALGIVLSQDALSERFRFGVLLVVVIAIVVLARGRKR